MDEAAAGGAVMAGAEGEAGLDLDADVVQPDLPTVVLPVDEKAPRTHGDEAGEGVGDPVALLRQPERRGLRGLLVRGGGDQRPDVVLVRLEAEIGLDQPSLAPARPGVVGLEGGGGGLGRLETLDDQVRDGARPPFVGDQRQAMGGVVGRQAFQHGARTEIVQMGSARRCVRFRPRAAKTSRHVFSRAGNDIRAEHPHSIAVVPTPNRLGPHPGVPHYVSARAKEREARADFSWNGDENAAKREFLAALGSDMDRRPPSGKRRVAIRHVLHEVYSRANRTWTAGIRFWPLGVKVNVVTVTSPSWVSKWRGSRVFVVGDVMLDKFVYGIARISPEAPIPILHHQSENAMLGGAANVARNVVALGGRAILAGAVGDDAEGDQIAGPLVDDEGIVGRFVRARGHPTTTKVRYVSGGHQIMRLDIERQLHLGPREIETICGWLSEAVGDVSAVVLSDYAKGVLVPALARRIIDIARSHGVPVVVDTKTCDLTRFAGATVMTPNASEATLVTGVECADDFHAGIAARLLYERARTEAVVLTRGAQGMTIYHPGDPDGPVSHAPANALEVFDVSGAGDTVAAALALALSAGAPIKTAARIGNAAAGIAVGKRGTAAVRARELSTILGGGDSDPKIVDHEGAAEIVADWRANGLKVGFTNGCFDLLHPGHVELLKRSRAVCDRLVVALNTDASVRRLKGEPRPVQNEYARSVVMAALDSVDLVTLFDEDTPIALIRLLRPDLLIKGADYAIATVVGAEFVASYGGRVVLVPIELGHSTTSIIARAAEV